MTHWQSDQCSIVLDESAQTATFVGELGFPSQDQYQKFLKPLSDFLPGRTRVVLDFTQLIQVNLNGLVALARVMILARSLGITLSILAKKEVDWHRSSLLQLSRLGSTIKLELL
ncbi:MAG: hypothetical protein AB7F28_02900 [Candidatus Margulisiibacteriota bacterium]